MEEKMLRAVSVIQQPAVHKREYSLGEFCSGFRVQTRWILILKQSHPFMSRDRDSLFIKLAILIKTVKENINPLSMVGKSWKAHPWDTRGCGTKEKKLKTKFPRVPVFPITGIETWGPLKNSPSSKIPRWFLTVTKCVQRKIGASWVHPWLTTINK